MKPSPVPPRIVEPDGMVHVGWYTEPVPTPNLHDAPVRHMLSALRGTRLGALERGYRRWRLKSWQYVSIVSPRTFFACAIVDAGYVANAFAYAVDRSTGVKVERATLAPLAVGARVADSSVEGASVLWRRGFGRIRFDVDAGRGERRVEVELDASGDQSALTAHYTIRDTGRDPTPIVVVEESEAGRWLYTHKCYGLQASGRLRFGSIRDDVAMGEAFAGLDFNRGYRPRQTWWSWAAGAGRATDGTRVGFNLTAHRRWDQPDAGDREDAGDCALWIGGACVKVRRVAFDYDRSDLMLPWRIADDGGLVDLSFAPLGERREDVELGLVASHFRQPYGSFSGTLRPRTGAAVNIDSVFGVTEQHYARW